MALEPNRRKSNEKAREYFEVTAITGHRIHRAYREFRIRWKGYSARSDSWLRERDLDGAIDLLQNYCVEHSLDLSNIEAYVGSSSNQANPEVWISLTQAVSSYEKIVKTKTYARYLSNLPGIVVKEVSDLPEHPAILFIALDFHCYVALFQPDQPIIYLADGSNESTAVDVRRDLRLKLGRSIQVRHFRQQTGVDHCGSSAILIALEFARAHKQGQVPKELVVSDQLARKLRRLHSALSQLIATKWRPGKIWLTCHHCQKKYSNNSRRSYFTHVRSHTRNYKPLTGLKK